MVHEMVHAVFGVYSCKGTECCRLEYVMEGQGLSGHGPAFKRVLEGVQEVALELSCFAEFDDPKKDPDPFGIGGSEENEREVVDRVWEKHRPGKARPRAGNAL